MRFFLFILLPILCTSCFQAQAPASAQLPDEHAAPNTPLVEPAPPIEQKSSTALNVAKVAVPVGAVTIVGIVGHFLGWWKGIYNKITGASKPQKKDISNHGDGNNDYLAQLNKRLEEEEKVKKDKENRQKEQDQVTFTFTIGRVVSLSSYFRPLVDSLVVEINEPRTLVLSVQNFGNFEPQSYQAILDDFKRLSSWDKSQELKHIKLAGESFDISNFNKEITIDLVSAYLLPDRNAWTNDILTFLPNLLQVLKIKQITVRYSNKHNKKQYEDGISGLFQPTITIPIVFEPVGT